MRAADIHCMPLPLASPAAHMRACSHAQVRGGIQGFVEPRPALVFVTSAGVERNAVIGDDEAARKADIPIVQLNPGATLTPFHALHAT